MTRLQWIHRLSLAVTVVLAAVVAVIGGVPTAVATRVGLYVVLAVVVESAVRLTAAAVPAPDPRRSPFVAAARAPRPRGVAPPERLEELQQVTWHGVRSIGGWHFRLRPVLRDLADGVLEDRRGVGLDRDPQAARDILGERAWELLGPDAVAPEDRWAEGLPVGVLEELVGRIEGL